MFQTNQNGLVAYKKQATLGTPATGAGASLLRLTGGNGLRLSKAAINSQEVRADGMSPRGRHGSQKLAAAYNAEVSLGSIDPIIEACMRSTWDSIALTKTQADFTSLTTGANTIILASGNPITMGFRVHDIIRCTGLPDAANNGKNLRITGLSATTITVAETLVVNAAADTTCSITRPGKRLINPATLSKAYFTLEEYEGDIDQSTVAQDFVWGSVKFTMQPDGLLLAEVAGTGTGQIQANATGASPYFTAPAAPTDVPFSVVDATIRLGGVDQVALTAFDMTLNIPADGQSGVRLRRAEICAGRLYRVDHARHEHHGAAQRPDQAFGFHRGDAVHAARARRRQYERAKGFPVHRGAEFHPRQRRSLGLLQAGRRPHPEHQGPECARRRRHQYGRRLRRDHGLIPDVRALSVARPRSHCCNRRQSLQDSTDLDLATLDARDEGDLVIRHPATLQPTGWTWTFYGPGHPVTVALADRATRDALRKAQSRRQAQANGRKWKDEEPLEVETIRRDNVAAIVERTKAFSPVRLDGKLIEFSPEAASALLLDRKKGWLLTQVMEYLSDEVNFIQPSATS
ncbi:phage tail tube protein [Bradyrhizobium diazoefficiens]